MFFQRFLTEWHLHLTFQMPTSSGENMAPRVMRILLIPDQHVWVAQCIDFDLAAQGATPRDAVERFNRILALQIRLDEEGGKAPLSQVPAPPRWFEEQFNKAWLGQVNDGPTIPPPFMLEARVAESNCVQS